MLSQPYAETFTLSTNKTSSKVVRLTHKWHNQKHMQMRNINKFTIMYILNRKIFMTCYRPKLDKATTCNIASPRTISDNFTFIISDLASNYKCLINHLLEVTTLH